MTPRTKLFTFALPEDLKAALQEIKVRDGISEAEQIRRGIRLWIASRRGVGEKTARKRAVTRRRS
jgi:Arc/MetJ-type ribon-helix-helix transcriptional regulator